MNRENKSLPASELYSIYIRTASDVPTMGMTLTAVGIYNNMRSRVEREKNWNNLDKWRFTLWPCFKFHLIKIRVNKKTENSETTQC